MKHIKLKLSVYIIMAFVLIVGCNQSIIGPLENNTTQPGIVTNVAVQNTPGGALLTYTLPSDQDLLYVEAEYTLASERVVTLKSSYYKNTILIEGFADQEEHEVTLYAVNRSETKSEPTIVKIQPLEAPIWQIFRDLKAQATFGGIALNTINKLRKDIAILIMQKDEFDDWIIDDKSIYTSTDTIARAIRPYNEEPHDFAFTIRDRWLNTTDTLFSTITPLPEVELPKQNYSHFPLPGDTESHPTAVQRNMWDGGTINWPQVFLTNKDIPGQHIVTFDVGRLAKLSRIVIWDYPEYINGRSYYFIGNLKEFEIWGSENPNPNGDLDDTWTLLGSYDAVKPSGLPYGQQSDEDFEVARAGFSWDFDPLASKVRYLRIKSLENWGGTGSMGIAEVQVYGEPE